MNSTEKIFLFDMDGTLTPPRQKISNEMVKALKRLSDIGKIGIVTGSDFDYVWDQVSAMFEVGGVPIDRVDIMPCNGTKKYTAGPDRNFKLVHDASMSNAIGTDNYSKILRWCVGWQWEIMSKFDNLPYTGTFVQYRGSLLNWCPIGRSATTKERESWVQVDKSESIRENYSDLLSKKFELLDIKATAALGGSTSIDIYPEGWDKTYSLRHCIDKEVYFTGDKCDKGGNDWHIYEALKSEGRSFKVRTPEDTIKIIEELTSFC